MYLRIFIILSGVLISSAAQAYREGEPKYFSRRLSDAAIERTSDQVRYDGGYRRIKYPNGDVPDYVGVCTDAESAEGRKGGDISIVRRPADRHHMAHNNIIGFIRVTRRSHPFPPF